MAVLSISGHRFPPTIFYYCNDTTDLSHLGVLSRMLSTLFDYRSRFSNIILNKPPTDHILVREVLNPALHVLT